MLLELFCGLVVQPVLLVQECVVYFIVVEAHKRVLLVRVVEPPGAHNLGLGVEGDKDLETSLEFSNDQDIKVLAQRGVVNQDASQFLYYL